MKIMAVLVAWVALAAAADASDEVFDIAILGGRVIDPETGLDGIRNVGISGDRIRTVTPRPLKGKRQIDASGLVVAPGFIDMHSHSQNSYGQTWQVRDGVTSALELEGGTHAVTRALGARQGKAYINYGFSSAWGSARALAKGFTIESLERFHAGGFDNEAIKPYQAIQKRVERERSTPLELQQIVATIEQDLDEGALGIGVPLGYMWLGTSDEELETLFRLAKRRGVVLFIHIRLTDDPSDVAGFQEIVDMARRTGAAVQMVHVVSTGLDRTQTFLNMMDAARADGFDITTEFHPYTAASTSIGASIFDDDWQSQLGVSYDAIEWPPTGKRFTGKKMWDEQRAQNPRGMVVVHMMKESMIELALRHPAAMVASDAVTFSPEQRAHPRGMGTFARVLGRFVRERQVINLANAIAKMSYLPARRLESFAPAMKRKGRVQAGADADLTLFDPDTVIDRATYAEPNQSSKGIEYVIVNGQVVVSNAAIVEGVFPGEPISTRDK